MEFFREKCQLAKRILFQYLKTLWFSSTIQKRGTLISWSVILGLAKHRDAGVPLSSKPGVWHLVYILFQAWAHIKEYLNWHFIFSLFKFSVLRLGLMLKLVFGGEKREIIYLSGNFLSHNLYEKKSDFFWHQVQVTLALYGATVASRLLFWVWYLDTLQPMPWTYFYTLLLLLLLLKNEKSGGLSDPKTKSWGIVKLTMLKCHFNSHKDGNDFCCYVL